MAKSKLGKWSLRLIILMPILFLIGSSFASSIYDGVSAGNTIPQDIGSRPLLALTMLAGMLSGVAAFVTGLTTIIKNRDRGVLVYASTVLGAGLILFLIAEIAFPH